MPGLKKKRSEKRWFLISLKFINLGWISLLTKTQNTNIDANFLYISRTNIDLRKNVLEQCLKECSNLVSELKCLKDILKNDVNYINLEILRNKDQPNKNLEEIEAAYKYKLLAFKKTKEVSATNFAIVS